MPSILQGGAKPAPMKSEPTGGAMPQGDGDGGGEQRSTLVSRGDGSHSIEHEDGTQTDHPHIGHALMHLAGKHSDGKHHHAHSDGMGGPVTTHKSEHGGEPEGPNEHENAESAAEEMKEMMSGEETDQNDEAGTMAHKGCGAKDSKYYD